MHQILAERAGGLVGGDASVLHGVLSLRHKVFSERLGWDVNSDNGMEYDFFDVMNPVFIVAKDECDQVEGCWRALPTTGPYMLRDTFPQLLRGEEIPNDPSVWELSRFAVSVEDGKGSQAAVSPVTIMLLYEAYNYAVKHGIKSYVTVTSVALERMLKRMVGVPLRRFGDKKAQRVGSVLSVAVWVDINDELRTSLDKAMVMIGAVTEAA